MASFVAEDDDPPHDFEYLSHWYYRLQEIQKFEFEQASVGITSIPNFMKIRSAILELLCVRMYSSKYHRKMTSSIIIV
jgi:hypothetical protein